LQNDGARSGKHHHGDQQNDPGLDGTQNLPDLPAQPPDVDSHIAPPLPPKKKQLARRPAPFRKFLYFNYLC
jgi:hypothetical protein